MEKAKAVLGLLAIIGCVTALPQGGCSVHTASAMGERSMNTPLQVKEDGQCAQAPGNPARSPIFHQKTGDCPRLLGELTFPVLVAGCNGFQIAGYFKAQCLPVRQLGNQNSLYAGFLLTSPIFGLLPNGPGINFYRWLLKLHLGLQVGASRLDPDRYHFETMLGWTFFNRLKLLFQWPHQDQLVSFSQLRRKTLIQFTLSELLGVDLTYRCLSRGAESHPEGFSKLLHNLMSLFCKPIAWDPDQAQLILSFRKLPCPPLKKILGDGLEVGIAFQLRENGEAFDSLTPSLWLKLNLGKLPVVFGSLPHFIRKASCHRLIALI